MFFLPVVEGDSYHIVIGPIYNNTELMVNATILFEWDENHTWSIKTNSTGYMIISVPYVPEDGKAYKIIFNNESIYWTSGTNTPMIFTSDDEINDIKDGKEDEFIIQIVILIVCIIIIIGLIFFVVYRKNKSNNKKYH